MSNVPGAKKIGRPAVGAVPVNVRFPPSELSALDAWVAAQPAPKPTRPEAVRRIVGKVLAKSP